MAHWKMPVWAGTPATASLEARIAVYALAVRMQLGVPGVADVYTETAATLRSYGADDESQPLKAAFARNCILAATCQCGGKTCLTGLGAGRAGVALLGNDATLAEDMCEVCEEACGQGADECTKCGDKPCCKACAAACRMCHDACEAMRL